MLGSMAINTPPQTIKPPALPPGGCIGIISPAYPSNEAAFIAGEKWLVTQGYRVKRFPNAANQWRYLAGTDAQRLADLHAAFADPDVDAIWCARGGYGSVRLVQQLDMALIAANPKPFIGFSDITVLQQAIYKATGLVTFYGPMVTSNLSELPPNTHNETPNGPNDTALPYTFQQALTMLTGQIPLNQPIPNKDAYQPITVPTNPIAEGPLLVGNLTLLASLCGTPYHPQTDGHIVVIEDWKEDFYALDRQFTQLRQAGLFNNIAGLLLGDFSHCNPQAGLTLIELFQELVGDLDIPTGYGFSIGHGNVTATLPIGCQAQFNPQTGSLCVLESPVST